MASRWTCVMRGISKPLVVLIISIKDDALGVVVPIPALPFAGNIFCALSFGISKEKKKLSVKITVFILRCFRAQRFVRGHADYNTRKGERIE